MDSTPAPHLIRTSIPLPESHRGGELTHGMSGTPEYHAFKAMWVRCTDTRKKDYALYKDRKPPEEWRDFSTFYAHIGPRPSAKHSLDRVDNEKPYGPGNVRWATAVEQANNTRANRHITYNGKTQTMAQWASEFGIAQNTLRKRLETGWPVDKAMTAPVMVIPLERANNTKANRHLTYDGRVQTLAQWASEFNLSQSTLDKRLVIGWSVEKALTTPINLKYKRN